ncbi:MAG: exo-alpha-sialidase [Planctomycetes bacterium]|nr:exo-alpha-sialidase [Planctomycetota bacterium]
MRRASFCCSLLASVFAASCVSWGDERAPQQPLAATAATEPVADPPIAATASDAVPGARWLDLEGDVARQVTVRRVPRRYLGHPTTVLLPDGRSMLCVHPEGHGRGPIVLQRSDDGGRSWSGPLSVPENWATSKETPTIHLLVDPRSGRDRLVLFSGLHPIRSSISNDYGQTWTPLAAIGDFGGIVAMASVVHLADGDYAAFFHDDGRFFRGGGKRTQFTVYQTRSSDGGLSWRAPTVVWTGAEMDLCEPGVVRSPDGKRLAMLLRENSRKQASQVMFSDDEGGTWSAPRPLPATLTGDRHVARYAPDGRLLVSFRDMASGSPTRGDWVAWVGRFEDLEAGREGQYRVRLSRNWRGTDCAYPGVEVLPDGTFVLVTYGCWEPGEAPFLREVRLRLAELDALSTGPEPVFTRPFGAVRPTVRIESWWTRRVADDLAAARAGGHRVVFLGDSITQGWNKEGAEVWREVWQPRQALNLGVSGDRTENVLWRLEHGLGDALAAANNDVRVVVLMIGTNNATGGECPAEEIAAGIEAVVRELRRRLPRAKVLLQSILPRGKKPDAVRTACRRASELAAAQLRDDPLVVHRDYAAHFVGSDGVISAEVMRDFLHLTAPAYRTWANALLPDVEALER